MVRCVLFVCRPVLPEFYKSDRNGNRVPHPTRSAVHHDGNNPVPVSGTRSDHPEEGRLFCALGLPPQDMSFSSHSVNEQTKSTRHLTICLEGRLPRATSDELLEICKICKTQSATHSSFKTIVWSDFKGGFFLINSTSRVYDVLIQ
jgi:hypothetical protein